MLQPFQESDVYFMSTACGRPQGGEGRLMWTHDVEDREGSQKLDVL